MGCVLSMSRNLEFNLKLTTFKDTSGIVSLWHNDDVCGQIDASSMELKFTDCCCLVPSFSRRYRLEIMTIEGKRTVIRLLATATDKKSKSFCCGCRQRRFYIDVDFTLQSVIIRRCLQKEHKRIWMPLCTPVLEVDDRRLSQNDEILSLRLCKPFRDN